MKRRSGDVAGDYDGSPPSAPHPGASRTGVDDDFDADYEEFEQIPWGMLSAELGPGRRFTTGAIVACVAAAAIAALVGFMFLRGVPEVVGIAAEAAGTTVAAPAGALPGSGISPPGAGEPAAATVPPGTGPPEEGGTGASNASPVPVTPSPSLYSEADLMAVMPEQELRLASVTAETYVAGAFTRDGVAGDPLGTAGKTPDGDAAVEEEPPAAVATAWVERVATVAIAPTGPGAYEVTVVVGVMAGDTEGVFRRLPLRSVRVPVALDEDGVAHVADLPTPVATPISAAVIPETGEAAPAPEKVLMGARNLVPWDEPVEVTSTHRTDTAWRVHLLSETGVAMVIEVPHP